MYRTANRRTGRIHARIASPASGAATNAAVSAVKRLPKKEKLYPSLIP